MLKMWQPSICESTGLDLFPTDRGMSRRDPSASPTGTILTLKNKRVACGSIVAYYNLADSTVLVSSKLIRCLQNKRASDESLDSRTYNLFEIGTLPKIIRERRMITGTLTRHRFVTHVPQKMGITGDSNCRFCWNTGDSPTDHVVYEIRSSRQTQTP
ncbi:hypothetical protein ABEB36_012668 [Hypothenemus hampei]|uniref:Uncharacterized protein n=1 Tax=Hypothenemus hampei TaxID=57062 RepID=A0ABD1EC10_HYPHA